MKVNRIIASAILGGVFVVSAPIAAEAASRTVDGSRTADSRTQVHPDFRLGYAPSDSRLPGTFFRL